MSIYLACLVFGGVLVGASVFGGHGDHDVGGDAGDVHDTAHSHGSALPFFSLRFWAFALAFFGLTGTALVLVGVAGALVPVVAGAFGVGAGFVSSRVLGKLAHATVGTLRDGAAHVGREGKLLLPVSKAQRGKVRLQVGGTSVDLVAETEGDDALTAGETAIIVGLRGNVALVERSPAAPAPPKERTSP
jgi:membrane protein implicated in regulation of membrane protease activity